MPLLWWIGWEWARHREVTQRGQLIQAVQRNTACHCNTLLSSKNWGRGWRGDFGFQAGCFLGTAWVSVCLCEGQPTASTLFYREVIFKMLLLLSFNQLVLDCSQKILSFSPVSQNYCFPSSKSETTFCMSLSLHESVPDNSHLFCSFSCRQEHIFPSNNWQDTIMIVFLEASSWWHPQRTFNSLFYREEFYMQRSTLGFWAGT